MIFFVNYVRKNFNTHRKNAMIHMYVHKITIFDIRDRRLLHENMEITFENFGNAGNNICFRANGEMPHFICKFTYYVIIFNRPRDRQYDMNRN